MFKLYVSILSGINKRRKRIFNSIAFHKHLIIQFILSMCATLRPYKNYSRIMLAKEKENTQNYKHSKLKLKSKSKY